ncbi:MAG: YraN family protein [Chlorobiaceae bacterium]
MTSSCNPRQLGLAGEQVANDYLIKKRYNIIKRNYRFHRNEIDIIARKGKTICFVEVKTRFSTTKGHPAEAVTVQKQHEIIKAAHAFLALSGEERLDYRFDVIAVLVQRMEESRIASFSIEHFTDAFWAPLPE